MAKLQPKQRINIIVQSATRLAMESGLVAVTHGAVAKRCTTPTSKETVKRYFPVKADLWRAAVEADETGTLAAQERELNG